MDEEVDDFDISTTQGGSSIDEELRDERIAETEEHHEEEGGEHEGEPATEADGEEGH
jgi:hypothetical protein